MEKKKKSKSTFRLVLIIVIAVIIFAIIYSYTKTGYLLEPSDSGCLVSCTHKKMICLDMNVVVVKCDGLDYDKIKICQKEANDNLINRLNKCSIYIRQVDYDACLIKAYEASSEELRDCLNLSDDCKKKLKERDKKCDEEFEECMRNCGEGVPR